MRIANKITFYITFAKSMHDWRVISLSETISKNSQKGHLGTKLTFGQPILPQTFRETFRQRGRPKNQKLERSYADIFKAAVRPPFPP